MALNGYTVAPIPTSPIVHTVGTELQEQEGLGVVKACLFNIDNSNKNKHITKTLNNHLSLCMEEKKNYSPLSRQIKV